MPVATRSQASATRGGDRPWSSSAAPRAPAGHDGGAPRRPPLLANAHHDLKEKLRDLNLIYEQQVASSQGAAALRRSRSIPPASASVAEGRADEQVERHRRGHAFEEAAVLRENIAPPEARAPSKNDNVVVFSRPKEKENVPHAANFMSCPAKKPMPALPAPAARKLSLGGGVGAKLRAIGETGAGNADAMGSRILVFVRLRPMSRKEKEAGSKTCVKIVNKKDVYLTELASENDYLRLKRVRGRHFCFDASFPDSTTQAQVYNTSTADLVEGVLQGRNGTVFCYGATGAGKTYTMLGTIENPGVMVLAIKDLFLKVRQRSHDGSHTIQLSYLEVYNETVRDLLSPGRPLHLREDKQQGTVAAGLTQYRAYSTDEVMKWLQQGNQNRTTEPTRVNETSSRSHAILQVVVEYRYMDGPSVVTRVGKLSLIDLAGSERALATDQRSQRSLEGANINRSLLALSSCINALVEGKKHVPYRNSKLTQLLKDSLGGSCNTVMIANISPSNLSFGETQNTLHWADRAKEIKTKAVTAGNEDIFKASDSDTEQAKLVLELQKENSELRQQVVKQQQKLLTVQAQSLAPNTTPQQSAAPSPHVSTPCSTQRKAKRSILDGSCFSTPNAKRPADNAQVRDLQRKVKTLEAEIEKMKKEHYLQLKQKDEFIRGLINRKNPNDPEAATAERRVITRASIRKAHKDAAAAGELKSPSHRFTSPTPTAKKRTFWDFGGDSPSVLAVNGRKTRSHVAAETPPRAPSMLLQPGFSRQRA
ncbi:kinesin-like protein KIN-8A [Lolium perenne]|uniref:kinesin-like protein KIN-8A n=1 Tax=Lolium perenne TaxID=4522 RepID=UPI0021F5F1A2|nr:kinesin-like protein KIN-8A [Lolium perenne]XP_051224844.1 kinesin-like protein KIN-8A [Lolium perenne]XP_051224845.1 kinesin-like protein KIN-8A [Lolium perenne]